MREFQDRRRFRKLMHSRYAIIVLVVICILLIRGVWGVYEKYDKSRDIADRTKNELSNLSAREQSLSVEIVNLSTELGKEREVRERFGVVKDGERLVVLVEDESLKKPVNQITEESWWQKFVNFFKFSNLRD